MLTLVIGNKNYSSWSLRAWLALKLAGCRFEELRIALDQPDTKARILALSPNGRVPCLIDRHVEPALHVWDSLAIGEYVNETYAGGRLWPQAAAARARARAVVAEMHSGFAAVRQHLSMDIRSRKLERGVAALARPEVADEVQRLRSIWAECLEASGGPFLFGEAGLADAFFAPVVTRFVTYGVPLAPALQAYGERVLTLPAMQQWIEAAHAETEVLEDH